MYRKVYIEVNEDAVEVACTVDGLLERYYRIGHNSATGNIYRGKVISVISAGAFVDIGRDKNGFLAKRTGLRTGEFVTVMAEREESESKGCLLTENLTVAGKYTVATQDGETHFSGKLDGKKRAELTEAFRGRGFVFRTACNDAEISDIRTDADKNESTLAEVIHSARNLYSVGLIYRADPLRAAENLAASGEIDYNFGEIRPQIDSLKQRRIEFNGVELVFDKTEAMTVVDVNSHRQKERYADPETMALNVNLIAVKFLTRQLRLRNIGGIIAVDFISMKKSENIEKLVKELNACLKTDDVKARAEFIDSLCIALITRKKRYASI